MSQFFVDDGGISPGGDVVSTSAQGGATFPPDAAGNVDFSGTATGAITFAQVANGLVTAAVQVDNITIVINGSNQLQAVTGITWSVITTDTLAVKGHGYMTNSISHLNVTLPSTPAVGDTVVITDTVGGTFSVLVDGSSAIQLVDRSVTPGTSITSTLVGDSITLVSRGLATLGTLAGAYVWICVPPPGGTFSVP